MSRVAEPGAHFSQLPMAAAARGFVSVRLRSPRGRLLDARGFRRATFDAAPEGAMLFQAYYGAHRVTRRFERDPDGSLPDGRILAAILTTAERMDHRHGHRSRNPIGSTATGQPLHPIYVMHGNEQAKLHELIKAMPGRHGGLSRRHVGENRDAFTIPSA